MISMPTGARLYASSGPEKGQLHMCVAYLIWDADLHPSWPFTGLDRNHGRAAGTRIMIDCGADWLGKLRGIAPSAILLTHAHPDHAAGLAKGAHCCVYAMPETLNLLRRHPVADLRKVGQRGAMTIGRLKFQAIPVQQSIRAPAVGYRVSARSACFFYAPDIAALPHATAALRGVHLYIGDGATLKRSMVRKKNGRLIGHATIIEQLRWCKAAGVPNAIFTHCGSEIVGGQTRQLNDTVERLGREHGIEAGIAADKDKLIFRAGRFVQTRHRRPQKRASATPSVC